MVLKGIDNQSQPKFDTLKWILASALILVGLVGNHYYSDVPTLWRTAGWLAVLGLAALVAATTKKGLWTIQFFKDSRAELRKVVWPTREETMQTTMVVAAMVVVLAIILWGLDGVLVYLIGWLTGQHG